MVANDRYTIEKLSPNSYILYFYMIMSKNTSAKLEKCINYHQ